MPIPLNQFDEFSQWKNKPIEDSLDEYSRMNGGQLESAVVSLTNYHSGRQAKLVGAIHIGSPAYYRTVADELATQDVVLYEGVKRKQDSSSLHLFSAFSRVNFDELYRSIAQEMTTIQKRKFDLEYLALALDELITNRPPPPKVWSLAAPHLSCISQGEAFDYHNLPQHWINADLSVDQLSRDWKVIFSRENLKLFGLSASIKKLGLQRVAAMAAQSLLGNLSQPRKERSATVHLLREQEFFNCLADVEAEQKAQQIGIFYGVGHLGNLESGLIDRGYERTSIKYVPVVWKKWTLREVVEKVLTEDKKLETPTP